MTVGLQSINNIGTLQLDENNFNLVYRTKGTATTSLLTGSQLCTVTFSVTATYPVLAIRSTSNYAYVVLRQTAANTWDVTIRTKGTSGSSVDWYLFDLAKSVGTGINYGIEIYNGSGELRFAGDQKPLTIIHLLQTADYGAAGWYPGPMNLTTGPTYALVFLKYAYYEQWNFVNQPFPGTYNYNYWSYGLGVQISGSQLYFDGVYLQNGTLVANAFPPAVRAGIWSYPDTAMLAIDVSLL